MKRIFLLACLITVVGCTKAAPPCDNNNIQVNIKKEFLELLANQFVFHQIGQTDRKKVTFESLELSDIITTFKNIKGITPPFHTIRNKCTATMIVTLPDKKILTPVRYSTWIFEEKEQYEYNTFLERD